MNAQKTLLRYEAIPLVTSKRAWLFAVALVGEYYLILYLTPSGRHNIIQSQLGAAYVVTYLHGAGLVVAIGTILLSYRAIAEKRLNGQLVTTAAMPLTRGELFAGKIVGRTVGIATLVASASIVVFVVESLRYGGFAISSFLVTLSLVVLYVFTLVTISISVSAVIVHPRRVIAVLLGVYFLLLDFFWHEGLAIRLYTFLSGRSVVPTDPPASGPLFGIHRATPTGATNTLINWSLGTANSDGFPNSALYEAQSSGSIWYVFVVDNTFEGQHVPWYLHESFALVILAAWIVVPGVIGYVFFARRDLT
ncbi:ABC transporter permease [Natrarchaeobius sp. A-rgal3]|uniref:ABC transporter permease n=1 Tax=Natrarchaeobius versutus TaxID=1679078 RepID=UPI00350EF6E1